MSTTLVHRIQEKNLYIQETFGKEEFYVKKTIFETKRGVNIFYQQNQMKS